MYSWIIQLIETTLSLSKCLLIQMNLIELMIIHLLLLKVDVCTLSKLERLMECYLFQMFLHKLILVESCCFPMNIVDPVVRYLDTILMNISKLQPNLHQVFSVVNERQTQFKVTILIDSSEVVICYQ